MQKLFKLFNFFIKTGITSIVYRLLYEARKKIGYYKLADYFITRSNISGKDVLISIIPIISKDFRVVNFDISKADKAINGNIYCFSNKFLNYTPLNNFAWNYNPISERSAPNSKPWHKIPDFGDFGDIKIIWEPSRFPHIYHFICAYSITEDVRYGKAARDTIIDWIEKNPYPYGVNYKCGQEISFRLFAWIVALDYFTHFFSDADRIRIAENIRISLRRIYSNYSYASKWVRNNHSVSEAAGLLVGGLVFPNFSESKKYVKKATDFLVKELSYQVFDDGAYIQHSFNYQRLVIDVLSFVILICNRTGYQLPQFIKEQHLKLTKFLASFVMPNGTVPNYGANDGAMLFPITDYCDYRESLNFAMLVNNNGLIFNNKTELCNFFGLDFDSNIILDIQKSSYPISGYFIAKNNDFFCFLRCHSYKTRPSHSDALHLDIWFKGANIFCDSGTFSYNTSIENKDHYTGAKGHNTVVLDEKDFMQSVFNFGKTNWPDCKVFDHNELFFVGEHYGYKKVNGITIRREVTLDVGRLIVMDYIIGVKKPTRIEQYWHTEGKIVVIENSNFLVNGLLLSSNINGSIKESKVSRFYNSYKEISKIVYAKEVDSDFRIETIFTIQ